MWRASGKSVREFADGHGLAATSLYQWIHPPKRRRGLSKGGGRERKPAMKTTFTEVSIVGQAAARGPAMTIALRCGHSVTFEGPAVDPEWLGSVLKVVSAC